MSIQQAWHVAAREFRLGPRSPLFLYAILLPIVMSFLISAVFGGLLDPQPKLGIVDLGASDLPTAAQDLQGIAVVDLEDAAELRGRVERHDLDAGLVLAADFDQQLRRGGAPDLEFYVSGDSLASSRIILGVAALDLIRETSGAAPPVAITVTTVGSEDFVPIGDRLLPIVVFYAVVIAALFLPASSLLDERESHTLDAVLVTPTRMSEVLLGKAILGVLMGVALGFVSLALNGATGDRPLDVLVFLTMGSVMMAELGLILGALVKDANSLYTAIKGAGVFIALPVIFIIWPTLPQWIPRLTPTYYFLQPVYEIAISGGTLGGYVTDLSVGCAICVALSPIVMAVGHRAETRLAWAA